MKTTIRYPSIIVAFALFLLMAHTRANGAQVEVATTVTPDQIDTCTYHVKIMIKHNVPTTDSTTTDYFYQQFPAGSTVIIGPSTCNALYVSLASFDSSAILTLPSMQYTVKGYLPGCEVNLTVTVPCDAIPGANNLFEVTYPTLPIYDVNTPSIALIQPLSFAAQDTLLPVNKPVMQFINFKDDVDECSLVYNVSLNIWEPTVMPAGTVFYNDPQTPKYVVSPTVHTRECDLDVGPGNVTSFTLIYTPGANLTPVNLVLQGSAGSVTISTAAATHGTPLSFPLTSSDINTLSDMNYLPALGAIHVTESFMVTSCSSPSDLDNATILTAEYNGCSGSAGCGSVSAERFTSVIPASGGITPSIHFEKPPVNPAGLDFCQGTVSDIVIRFENAKYDCSQNYTHNGSNPGYPCNGDGTPGSARKTFHWALFPLKTDVFSTFPTTDNIFLEASTHIAVSTLPGFYTYNSSTTTPIPAIGTLPAIPPRFVLLNFDALTTPPTGGILQNDLISAGAAYNQIDDSAAIELRFSGVVFDCADARFYPDNPSGSGFTFDSYPKPDNGYMFFGDAGQHFQMGYENECETAFPIQTDFGGFFYNFPVDVEAEAANTTANSPNFGHLDMLPNDTAKVNFAYNYVGGEANPSPFAFEPPQAPNSLYFKCVPKYQAKLFISDKFSLIGNATYYSVPSLVAAGTPTVLIDGTPGTYTDPTTLEQFKVYTYQLPPFPLKSLMGHIEANVILNNCPDPITALSHGGLDTFRMEVQALCSDCDGCADTIADVSTALSDHCGGDCPVDTGPQNTTSFVCNRGTFGFDEALSSSGTDVPMNLSTAIEKQHLSPCDTAEFVATGFFDVVPANPNAVLAFQISYSPLSKPSLNPYPFEFFEFQSGFVKYFADNGSGNQGTPLGTYHIWKPTDIAASFNDPSPLDWPTSYNGPASDPNSFYLFTNFKDTTGAGNVGSDNNLDFLKWLSGLNGPKRLQLEIHLTVKVKPLGNGLNYGDYPLLTKGQWLSELNPAVTLGIPNTSCDPYRAFMEVLAVTSTPYAFIFDPLAYEARGDEICGRPFEFGLKFQGGLRGFPEYSGEKRYQAIWPANITMTLPSGLHLSTTHNPPASFTVLDAGNNLGNGFQQPGAVDAGYPVHITSLSPLTFSGYENAGPQPWPKVYKDGTTSGLRVFGWLGVDYCTPIASQTISLAWPYTAQAYADVPCQVQNPSPQDLTYLPPPAPTLVLDYVPSQTFITSLPGYIDGFKFTYLNPTLTGSTIHNAYLKIAAGGAVVTSISLNGSTTPIYPNAAGYYQLGNLGEGVLASDYITLNGVSFPNCTPDTAIPMTVYYGFSCNEPVLTDTDAEGACGHQKPLDFNVKVAPSDMALIPVESPSDTTGVACKDFVYHVRLESEKVGQVLSPKLRVTISGCLNISSVTYATTVDHPTFVTASGPLTHVSPALNSGSGTGPFDYTFDINQDAYQSTGMPGAGAYCDVYVTVNGSCACANSDPIPAPLFTATGVTLCGDVLTRTTPPTSPLTISSGTLPNPVINFPVSRNIACADPTDPADTGMASGTDSCGNAITAGAISYEDEIIHCGIKRTWHVSVCGQTFTQVQTLSYPVETTPPTIDTCAPDQALTLDPTHQCQAIMPDLTGQVHASDDCKVASITQSILPGLPLTAGTYTVVFTVCDECGNCVTCTCQVTVPPVISFSDCPSDISVPCDDDAGATVTYTPPTATDLCCPGNVSVTCSPVSGAKFPIGVTPVACTAVDACGNISTCTFTVTVIGHGYGRWTWARRGGGMMVDSGQAVAVDAQGNVFVTGSFHDTMNFLPDNSSITLTAFSTASSVFVAKYNALGNLLWARRAGGDTDAAGNGVTVDADGNAFVTGEFVGTAQFGSFSPTSDGNRDIFVAKYSPDGTCLWAINGHGTLVGTGDDYGSGIAWTPVGNNPGDGGRLFVTGQWGSPAIHNGPNVKEAFILAVSDLNTAAPTVQGPVLSAAASGSGNLTQSAKARAVAVDGAGNAYITGIYGGQAATVFPGSSAQLPGPDPNSRLFVAKFDPALNSLWTQHGGHTGPGAPASGNSDAFGIAVSEEPLGSGNIFCYVTANYYGGNSTTAAGVANFGNNGSGADICVTDVKNTPSGQDQLGDYLIVKYYPSSDQVVWAITGGGDPDSEDETRGIVVGPDDNLCVTGYRQPNAPNPFINEGPTVLVASYDSSAGYLRWMRNADDVPSGSPQDIGNGIAVNAGGCVHVTGDFTETLAFPPVPSLTDADATGATRDMFVAKMCPTCGDCGCAQAVNLVVNGSFELPPVTTDFYDSSLANGQVPGWTATASGGGAATIELWNGTFGSMTAQNGAQHLEINANTAIETVSQVVSGLTPGVPASFCFWYVGRPGFADNTFTVQLIGGNSSSATLNPAAYVSPASWQHYSATFVPASPTVTIAFTGAAGKGAHIDNVSLTQAGPKPCIAPVAGPAYSTWPADLTLSGSPADPVVSVDILKLITPMNSSSTYEFGTAVLPNFNGVNLIHAFRATFKLYIGGGTTADGFSFNLADDVPAAFAYGPFIEEGIGSGLTVEFDTYDNGNDPTGIYLKFGGPATVPIDGSGPNPSQGPTVTTPGWKDVEITMDTCGYVQVFYNSQLRAAGYVGYVPGPNARFVLGARTGAQNDNHWVKDLVITTQSDAPDITVTAPPGQCCAPANYAPCFTASCDPIVNTVCVPSSGTCFPVGRNRVCCTATDSAGNQASYGFYVIVQSTTPPVIVNCAPNRVLPADSQCQATVPDMTGELQITHDCPITIVQNPPANSVLGTGIHPVVFTVCDAAGNCVSCTTYVTVGCYQESCVVPPANMVFWLPLDETAGPDVFNAAGGLNGLDVGNVVVGTAGEVGNAVSFPGNYNTVDHVAVPSYGDITFGNHNFSFDAWIYPTSEGTSTILNKFNSDTGRGYIVYLDLQPLESGSVYNLSAYLGGGPSGGGYLHGGSVQLNRWSHVAMTVDRKATVDHPNGVVTFYVNGHPQAAGDNPPTGTYTSAKPVWLGEPQGNYPSMGELSGVIDEVELFNRKLEDAEVQALFAAGPQGKCKFACYVPPALDICLNENSIDTSGTICNYSATTRDFNYSFQGCGGGAVPSFTPSGGTITVPAGQCVPVPVTIARPPGGCCSSFCYQMTMEPVGSGTIFQSSGTVQEDDTICYHLPCCAYLTILVGTYQTALLPGLNLENTGGASQTISYRWIVLDTLGLVDTNNVSLNGLPPGTPITNSVSLAPSGTTNVVVRAGFVQPDPLGFYNVVFQRYVNGTWLSLASYALQNRLVLTDALPLVTRDNVWSYQTNGAALPTNWVSLGYDDSSWPSGVALFGFETSPLVYPWPFHTFIAPPGDGGKITTYVRTHFNWNSSTTNIVLTATNYVKDGAVFYLNGTEVGRLRMPPGPVDPSTLAYSQLNAGQPEVLTFSTAGLQSGDNVLAVEVHQDSTNSTADVFGMELYATTVTTGTNQLQIAVAGNLMLISWSGPGTLQTTFSLSPPITWTNLTNTSPYTNTPAADKQFYRLQSGP